MPNDRLDIIKRIDNIEKGIKRVVPSSHISSTTKIQVKNIKGDKYEFKFKPLNVLEVAELAMGYTFLSDPQKDVLVDIWGLNPEVWDTSAIEYVLGIGQGGGKNIVMEVSVNYALLFLCNLVEPYRVFSDLCNKTIPINTNFEITNNSMVGEQQANTVFFDRMKAVLKVVKEPETGSNYYAKYMNFDLRDEGMGDMKKKVIEFPPFFKDSGRIKLHSLDSGVSSFEGKNIILALMDEPSRADSLIAYLNASKLRKGLIGNITTRFPKQVGKLFEFSYLNNTEYDLTHELIVEERELAKKAAEEQKKYITSTKTYVFSTYQFNPSVSKTDPDKIKDYDKDPDDSQARYECVKSRTQYAFLKPHVEMVKACAMKDVQNRITYIQRSHKKKFRDTTEKPYSVIEILEIKGDERFRCWACDTSINKDRFVLKSGYIEDIEATPDQIIKSQNLIANKRAIVDLIIIWSPTKLLPVDFNNVAEIIDKCLDAFPNSVYYKGDRYQSESIASIFEQRGIRASTVVFSQAQQFRLYSNIRTAIFNNLVAYLNEPLLIEELERVQKVAKANKIEHPMGFSKDCADVLVQLYELLTSEDFINFTATTGIDTFTDTKLIDMCDKLARAENKARKLQIHPTKEKDFICTELGITDREYKKIKDAYEVFFPK